MKPPDAPHLTLQFQCGICAQAERQSGTRLNPSAGEYIALWVGFAIVSLAAAVVLLLAAALARKRIVALTSETALEP